MQAKITERGNGFPSHGEMVYDSSDNTLYRITTDDRAIPIRTGDPGSGTGNYIIVDVENSGEPCDLTQAEWDAIPDVDVQIMGD